jgi:hypothetical protein
MSWSRAKSAGYPEPLRLAQVLHVPVLRVVHDDLGSGIFEQAQPAGVVGVQVARHHVAEVVRAQLDILQPGKQADLGGDLAEIDQLLPRLEPFRGPLGGDAGVPQEQPVGVLDHIAQDGAPQPVLLPGAPVDVQDEVGVWEDHQLVVRPSQPSCRQRTLMPMPDGPTRPA